MIVVPELRLKAVPLLYLMVDSLVQGHKKIYYLGRGADLKVKTNEWADV